MMTNVWDEPVKSRVKQLNRQRGHFWGIRHTTSKKSEVKWKTITSEDNIAYQRISTKAVVAITNIVNAKPRHHYFPNRRETVHVIFMRKAGKNGLLLLIYRPISLLSAISRSAKGIEATWWSFHLLYYKESWKEVRMRHNERIGERRIHKRCQKRELILPNTKVTKISLKTAAYYRIHTSFSLKL